MHRITVQYSTPSDPPGFDGHYRDVHLPLVRALPGLRRCSLSRPRGLGGPAPYLVAEMWFDDADALKAALKSPEMAATGADAKVLAETYGVAPTMFSGAVEDV